MKKRIIMLFSILFCAFPRGFAQTDMESMPEPPIKITHKQMYNDFDQFLDIVRDYNSQWEIRKTFTGYDIFNIYAKRRKEIRKIKNYWQFIGFMNDNLYYLLDSHAAMHPTYYKVSSPIYAPGQTFYDSVYVADVFNGYIQYKQYCGKTKKNRKNTSLKYETVSSQYIDGQYYMAAHFTFINPQNNDSICFDNAKIISYNNMPIDDYVMRQMGFWSPASVRWDFSHKKYYTDALYLSFDKLLTIEDEQGKIIEFRPNDYPVQIQQNVFKNVRDSIDDYVQRYWNHHQPHQVLYLPEQQILYIYSESMFSQNNYNLPDTIKQIGKDKNISKIVIDVRGNHGGGDEFWINILSSIIKNPILVEDKVALNANDNVLSFFKTEYPDEVTERFSVQEIPFLREKKMLVNTRFDSIVPDSNSLNYEGQIFIFQDGNTFSSAHSFASLSRHVSQLVSVGESTGNMVGFGFNPWGWQLDFSKFTFKFEPAIDLSGATKWEDTFQCVPEIEVQPTLRELNEYNTYRWTMDTQLFLLNKDYLFRKIIEIE